VLFEVERATVLGRPALRVRGDLDLEASPHLAEAVESLLATGPAAMVVDLTGTTFLDSSGARQLVRTARRADADGVALQVVCPADNHPVRLVIDLLDLHLVVPVVEPGP
jgi:anti-sigma B factor antagonist